MRPILPRSLDTLPDSTATSGRVKPVEPINPSGDKKGKEGFSFKSLYIKAKNSVKV